LVQRQRRGFVGQVESNNNEEEEGKSGRACGSILEMGAAFVSYDAAGERIGTYKTQVAASRSIPRGREES
jgi:hypothetical protein